MVYNHQRKIHMHRSHPFPIYMHRRQIPLPRIPVSLHRPGKTSKNSRLMESLFLFFSFLVLYAVVCWGIQNATEWNHTYISLCFIQHLPRGFSPFFLFTFYFFFFIFLIFYFSLPQFLFYYIFTHSPFSFFFFFFVHGHDCANNAHWDEPASSSFFSISILAGSSLERLLLLPDRY